jgi:hypothetical protein
MEEIDLAFQQWANQAQPIAAILQATGSMTTEKVQVIQSQLKHAFTHGYARGVAHEVAKFPPPDPNLGPVR